MDLLFPLSAKLWFVIIVFVVGLLVFHVLFVSFLKLGKIAWKRIDYVWLGFGAMGLISAAAQARQISARHSFEMIDERVSGAYSLVQFLVDDYSREGTVCRVFTRSELSPAPNEFDRVQREYDTTCRWFREIASSLPRTLEPNTGEITSLLVDPNVTAGDLKDIIQGFRRQLSYYNAAAKQRSQMQLAAQRSGGEEFLILATPILLSLALALRITKVTGEIRLER